MHARLLSNAKDVLVTVLKCQPSVSDSLLLSFMNVLEFTWISIPESPSPPPLREIGCSLIGATDARIMGRKTHALNTCAQVAASEHLYDAIFRCKQIKRQASWKSFLIIPCSRKMNRPWNEHVIVKR